MIDSLPADSIDVDRAALSERLASLVPPLARVRFVIVKQETFLRLQQHVSHPNDYVKSQRSKGYVPCGFLRG